jgi:hypothetical protein
MEYDEMAIGEIQPDTEADEVAGSCVGKVTSEKNEINYPNCNLCVL